LPELNIAKKLDGGSYSYYYFARFQWSINNVNINKPKIVEKGVNLGALSSPFTKDELKALYSTQVLTDPSSRLRVDLALRCGLSARQIAGFIADNVVDSEIADKSVYNVTIAGKCMPSHSVSNVISKAREELAEQGIVLKDSFNDLRRTFAINYAGFLSSKNLQIDSIKLWSAHLLVNSHSSTTQQYIKSSESLNPDKLLMKSRNTKQ